MVEHVAVVDGATAEVREPDPHRHLPAGRHDDDVAPVGAAGRVAEGLLTLRGTVLSPDGRRRLVATASGPAGSARAVGTELASDLLAAGARELLAPVGG